jgi:hypothetical protein
MLLLKFKLSVRFKLFLAEKYITALNLSTGLFLHKNCIQPLVSFGRSDFGLVYFKHPTLALVLLIACQTSSFSFGVKGHGHHNANAAFIYYLQAICACMAVISESYRAHVGIYEW